MNFLDLFFGTLLLVVLLVLCGVIVLSFQRRKAQVEEDEFWKGYFKKRQKENGKH